MWQKKGNLSSAGRMDIPKKMYFVLRLLKNRFRTFRRERVRCASEVFDLLPAFFPEIDSNILKWRHYVVSEYREIALAHPGKRERLQPGNQEGNHTANPKHNRS